MTVLIAWDVDDVLNDLTREWLAAFSRERGVAVAYEELAENPPNRLLRLERAEYLASLDAFRARSYQDLAPNSEIQRWLAQEGHRARHVAMSAVPLRLAHHSAAWVMRHFGAHLRGFHVVPSPRPDDPVPVGPPDKAEALALFAGRTILVDDSAENVRKALAAGHGAVLFPRPWNGGQGGVREALEALTNLLDRKGDA